jgi:hypothetical protein
MPLPTVPRLFTLALVAYAAYVLLVFLLQRQLLYPGRHLRVGGPPPAGIVPIAVVTTTSRGEGHHCGGGRGNGAPW